MKIISLNVSLPHLVEWHGEPVTTGIFKEPVDGPLMLRRLNLDGDRQADLNVHGGKSKAVYVYPSAHYEFWRKELYAFEKDDLETLRRAAKLEALSESWRGYFQKQIQKLAPPWQR
jgi:MOSC domain-containing protein YiiM